MCGFYYEKKRNEHRCHFAAEPYGRCLWVPKDVALGMPILTVTGNSELCLENYRGIQEYTDTLIRIQTKTGQIKLHGTCLKVEYYTNDEMKVTGILHSVEYQ